MGDIKFKIAAKTDSGLVRTNNEDNFQAASDLSVAPMKWVNDTECILGDKGALLVVADGMGGMNAGEVASEIAIETIKECFAPDKISDQILSSESNINFFLKKAIIEADRRIKNEAQSEDGHKGMGTTIVISWLIKDKLYVAWCGDSRAYVFNRLNGIKQITKDHSYVQTLIDKHKIKPEEAFDFPDSNIITRSLGDSNQKARPDVLPTPIVVCNGDIVLLCTDGLSGMIRNHEIEQVLMEYEDNLSECADNLIKSACDAAGEDNITVALCKIISGCSEPTKVRKSTIPSNIKEINSVSRSVKMLIPLLLGLLLGFLLGYNFAPNKNRTKTIVTSDTTIVTTSDTLLENDNNEIKNDSDEGKMEAPALVKIVQKKSDTIYIVKKYDVISAIEKAIGRSRDSFNIMRGDSPVIYEGVIVSDKIREHDTLFFKTRLKK